MRLSAGEMKMKVIIDAGHGGKEPGAIYGERKEKDDTLRLALAVGEILKKNGIDVAFTRTEDVYNSPFEKAQLANREGGDFLISIHRNASPESNQYSGVESLVFDRSGKKVELAENINRELEEAGYRNLGIKERPGLVILRRSQMPAVLVEVGFLNTDADNLVFDRNFEGIAEAIARGVLETVREDAKTSGQSEREPDSGKKASDEPVAAKGRVWKMDTEEDVQDENGERALNGSCGCCVQERLYRVQTGAFRNREYAQEMLEKLLSEGFPAFLLLEDRLYKVQVGAYRMLDNAVRMERALRDAGYVTFITT